MFKYSIVVFEKNAINLLDKRNFGTNPKHRHNDSDCASSNKTLLEPKLRVQLC